MNITEHRLELQPEAEQASDFIAALVAHYESQIDELKQQSSIAFRVGSVPYRAATKTHSYNSSVSPGKTGDRPRGFARVKKGFAIWPGRFRVALV
jgi:hypothetical protein